MSDYQKGFRDGFEAGYNNAVGNQIELTTSAAAFSKPKRKQSKKQKLLTSMTAKKWKAYSKGSGRKTYVEIRSQVSRSKAYKSKAKKL